MKFNVNFQCNVKFNEVTMIYNALSVSGIQQSDCLYMHCICIVCVCIHVKVAQLRPTLCDPMDSSPPGSSVHGLLQARMLE